MQQKGKAQQYVTGLLLQGDRNLATLVSHMRFEPEPPLHSTSGALSLVAIRKPL